MPLLGEDVPQFELAEVQQGSDFSVDIEARALADFFRERRVEENGARGFRTSSRFNFVEPA